MSTGRFLFGKALDFLAIWWPFIAAFIAIRVAGYYGLTPDTQAIVGLLVYFGVKGTK